MMSSVSLELGNTNKPVGCSLVVLQKLRECQVQSFYLCTCRLIVYGFLSSARYLFKDIAETRALSRACARLFLAAADPLHYCPMALGELAFFKISLQLQPRAHHPRAMHAWLRALNSA